MSGDKKRILILGGGFGGVYTAMNLEKILKPEEASISLINRENYWINQPMLPEVISSAIGITDVVSPIRLLCPRTDLVMRSVENIDLKKKVVTVSPGFRPRLLEIPYDYLVIALGSVTNFSGMPGMLEHALPFRTLADALMLRNHVIHTLEEANVESDPVFRTKLLTFVVAGGGFSGVEAVAELNDFVRHVKHNYIRLRDQQVRVVLVHSGDRILPEMDDSLARFAQRLLTKRGVELVLKDRLAAATSEKAILKSGAEIACKTVVSTVPSAVAPVLQTLDCSKQKNRLLVDGNLELAGYEGEVWALGDCASIKTKSGKAVPPTAQHATREAKTVAMNIAAVMHGGKRSVFAFEGLGTMGSLGHYSAIANIMGLKVSGFLAWMLWRMIYLMKVPGFNRQLRIALDWLVAIIFPPDLVQVKFFRGSSMMSQHFEPGEVIFNQGDIGDKVYVIQKGECEVLRESGGEAVRLATLGKGEYFGEMAILQDVSRNATVKALTAMDVVMIEKHDFNLLKAGVPAFGQVFQELARARSGPASQNPSGEKTQP